MNLFKHFLKHDGWNVKKRGSCIFRAKNDFQKTKKKRGEKEKIKFAYIIADMRGLHGSTLL